MNEGAHIAICRHNRNMHIFLLCLGIWIMILIYMGKMLIMTFIPTSFTGFFRMIMPFIRFYACFYQFIQCILQMQAGQPVRVTAD